MSLTITDEPEDIQSLTKPDEWTVISTLTGNNEPDDEGTILSLRPPTSGEVTTYSISPDQEVLELSAAPVNAYTAGMKVMLEGGADTGSGEGPHLILNQLTTTLYVVDSPITAGGYAGGNVYRLYENYRCKVNINYGDLFGDRGTIEFYVPEVSGAARVSVHDISKRFFADPWERIRQINWPINHVEDDEDSVTIKYYITFTETYTDTDGSEATLDVETGAEKTLLFSQHEKAYSDVDGNFVRGWRDDYSDYTIVTPIPSPYTTKTKYLSNAPSTLYLKDLGFLTVLTSGTVNLTTRFTAYDKDDNFLWTFNPSGTDILNNSGLLPIGPLYLEESGQSMDDVHYYDIRAIASTEDIYDTVRVYYVTCPNAQTFLWRNRLGGLDAHAFQGRKEAVTQVERSVANHTYNERKVYRTETAKQWTITTPVMGKEHRYWLAELFESPDTMIYISQEQSGVGTLRGLYPVIIDSDLSFLDTGEQNSEIQVVYEHGFDNRV